MGKIKQRRHKYHIAAKKKPENNDFTENQRESEASSTLNELFIKPSVPSSDIFKNFSISKKQLKENLFEFDKCSSILSTSTTGSKLLKKKDKRKLRHEAFLQKFEASKLAKKKEAAALKRRQTPVVGDMKPLEDALPTLELLMKQNEKKIPSESTKPVACRSFKAQKKLMLQDIEAFNMIRQHPTFKADPFGTISKVAQITDTCSKK